MNYTVCIIQSQAIILKNFLIYFPEKDWDLSVLSTNLIEPILEHRTSINFQSVQIRTLSVSSAENALPSDMAHSLTSFKFSN